MLKMESFDTVRNTSFFQFFRKEGFPTSYPGANSFPEIDLVLAKILTLSIGLWIIFLIISHGYLGRERLFFICRITVGLFIGTTILACNLSPYWEVNSVVTLTRYRPESAAEVIAEVGLKIGLYGFNVTLREIPSFSSYESSQQPVNFNERFEWDWAADKASSILKEVGYLEEQYRQASRKGLPLPILWTLEYFTVDGEGFRFGRFYQRSGWYCHIFMWLSLGCWTLSSILFCIVVEYGSLMMMLTGAFLSTTNIIFALAQNPNPMSIPFRSPVGGKVNYLEPDYSWSYYVNMINGLTCILLGLLVYLVDIKYPDLTAQFFGIDVVQNYDQYFQEIEEEKKRKMGRSDEKSLADDPATEKKHQQESNYVALRKKVTSNRLSMLHRLTLREKVAHSPGNKETPGFMESSNFNGNSVKESYYVIPRTVKVPIQPRIIGSLPRAEPESFEISTQ